MEDAQYQDTNLIKPMIMSWEFRKNEDETTTLVLGWFIVEQYDVGRIMNS
jgi:hypothetical protein